MPGGDQITRLIGCGRLLLCSQRGGSDAKEDQDQCERPQDRAHRVLHRCLAFSACDFAPYDFASDAFASYAVGYVRVRVSEPLTG
jgi:hypothetical protein